jgi:hypothetical protein
VEAALALLLDTSLDTSTGTGLSMFLDTPSHTSPLRHFCSARSHAFGSPVAGPAGTTRGGIPAVILATFPDAGSDNNPVTPTASSRDVLAGTIVVRC